MPFITPSGLEGLVPPPAAPTTKRFGPKPNPRSGPVCEYQYNQPHDSDLKFWRYYVPRDHPDAFGGGSHALDCVMRRTAITGPNGETVAPRHELMLPCNAPDCFDNIPYVVGLFDALPKTSLMMMMKVACNDPEEPLHAAWTRVNLFVRSMIVEPLGHPAIMVLHNPVEAISLNPPHIHVMVLTRPITANGFGPEPQLAFRDEYVKTLAAVWDRYHGRPPREDEASPCEERR